MGKIGIWTRSLAGRLMSAAISVVLVACLCPGAALAAQSDRNGAITAAADGTPLIASSLGVQSINEAKPIALNTSVTDHLGVWDSYYQEWQYSGSSYYKVTLPEAGVLSVAFSSSKFDGKGSDGWWISLVDSNDLMLMNNYDYHVGVTAPPEEMALPSVGLPAGNYYIRVGLGGSTFGIEYSLRANFQASDAWETEQNNSLLTADDIEVGKTYWGTGTHSYTNDGDTSYDYFKVMLPSSGPLSITYGSDYFSSDGREAQITLMDGEGRALQYDTFGYGKTSAVADRQFPAIGLPQGTYYIRLYSYASEDAIYHIRVDFEASEIWETEFNDSVTQADSLPVNTRFNGTLCSNEEGFDKDYYRVELDRAGAFTAVFDCGYFDGKGEVALYVALLDEDGGRMTQGSYRCGVLAPPGAKDLFTVGLPAGTYYLEVLSPSYSDSYTEMERSGYTLEAEFTSSSVWETEPNDDLLTADAIDVNTTYYGTADQWGAFSDYDYLKFSLSQNKTVSISLGCDYFGSQGSSYYFELMDSNGNTVPCLDSAGQSAYSASYSTGTARVASPVNLRNLNLAKGTYYIYIQGSSSCEYPYGWPSRTYALTVTATTPNLSDAVVTGIKDATYTGSAITQSPTVKHNGVKLVKGTDYTLEYQNNKAVGTASVTVKGRGSYEGKLTKTFKITKAANPMTASAKAKTHTFTYSPTVVRTITAAKAYTVKSAKGAVTYEKKSGNAAITVAKDGKVTVKKNLAAGSYPVTVKVTAAGDANYKALTKPVSFTVKIAKAANPLSASGKNPSVSYAKVKRAKQAIAASKAYTVKNAKGAVTYAKKSGNSKISVASNGKITVAKGTPRKTYPVTVKVTAKGNANYASVTKTVTVKVKVA